MQISKQAMLSSGPPRVDMDDARKTEKERRKERNGHTHTSKKELLAHLGHLIQIFCLRLLILNSTAVFLLLIVSTFTVGRERPFATSSITKFYGFLPALSLF